jgi:hypothetical protein
MATSSNFLDSLKVLLAGYLQMTDRDFLNFAFLGRIRPRRAA